MAVICVMFHTVCQRVKTAQCLTGLYCRTQIFG